MPTKKKAAEEYIPLTPRTFHILLALKDGIAHGYSIMKEVEERSSGQVRIGPGTLYEAISRMVSAGLLKEVATPATFKKDRRRRRFYKVTALGRKVMRLEAQRLAELVGYVRQEELLAEGW
jgi:DNA-binding PadR family transcriptional regulator